MPLEVPAAPPAAPAPVPAPPIHPAAVQPPPAGADPNPMVAPPAPAPAAPAPPAPAGTVTAPPPAPTLPPAATQMVSLPIEQLQAFVSLQARVAQMEAEQHAREQAAQAEQARILAERGQAIEALNVSRTQHEQALQREREERQRIEASAARYALDGELSRALAAHNLVPGGADQLATLWRGHFTAVNENGTYAVRNAQFETPTQFVQRQLAAPEYAHFLRASTQGGTAAGQAPQAAQTPPAQAPEPVQPKTMGEAVILAMQSRSRESADPRANPAVSMIRGVR